MTLEDSPQRAALLYLRTARTGEGLDEQRQKCLRASRRLGLRVVGEAVDDGISGISPDRPAFRRLLAKCARGVADTVIVADLTRLARNRLLDVRLQRDIANSGARLVAADATLRARTEEVV